MLVFVGTLFIFLLVVGILLWVKTPHYQMSRQDVIHLFQQILVGQATENDWAIFLSSSFRHLPALESIRQECLLLDEQDYKPGSADFLLTEAGLAKLRQLLYRVESLDD
jgi:hypothetical protein